MSQLQAAREDPGPVIERGIRVSGTAAGVVLTALAASASGLVPGVFGEQWSETAVAVQWVCVSLIVAAPLAVVAVGFLYAIGEPSVVLRATIAHTLTLFAVAFPLLPFIGVNAIGAGSLAGAVVDAVLLGRAVSRRSSARPFRLMAVPLLLGVPAGARGLGRDARARKRLSCRGRRRVRRRAPLPHGSLLLPSRDLARDRLARPALGPGRSRPGPRGADPRRPTLLAQELVEHARQVGHEPRRAAAQQDIGIRLGRLLPATPAVDLETDQLSPSRPCPPGGTAARFPPPRAGRAHPHPGRPPGSAGPTRDTRRSSGARSWPGVRAAGPASAGRAGRPIARARSSPGASGIHAMSRRPLARCSAARPG